MNSKRDFLVSANKVAETIRFGQETRVPYSAAMVAKLRGESTLSFEVYNAAEYGTAADVRFTGFAHWCNRPWLVILENAPESR